MGIPVGAKTSKHKSRREGVAGQGGSLHLPANPLLNHVLVWEWGGSINVNKLFFNGPNNTGNYVLVYRPFFNATLKALS